MAQYGLMHRTADFIQKSISASGENSKYVIELIKLVQSLDNAQESNQSITVLLWASDGMWITFRGRKLFLILPRKQNIRMLYGKDLSPELKGLHEHILSKATRGGIEEISTSSDYYLWKVPAEGFEVITKFVANLPQLGNQQILSSHPRHFPGEVRQVALDQFEKDGRWCNGVSGQTKRHKLTKDELIEYDHIIPYSKGGSSSALNIQILCAPCNRAKLAKAL